MPFATVAAVAGTIGAAASTASAINNMVSSPSSTAAGAGQLQQDQIGQSLEQGYGEQQQGAGTALFGSTLLPYNQGLMAQDQQNAAAEGQLANSYGAVATGTYLPELQQFTTEANNYASPTMQNQNAAMAGADVNHAYTAARNNATQQLESYGIDPSQTRYGALDLGTQISQAAAEAGAMTQARMQTQQAGLQLQSQALGAGAQAAQLGNQASSASTAASTGGSAIGSSTANEFGSLEGTGTGWFGLGNSMASNATNGANALDNATLASNQYGSQQMGALGQGLGALASYVPKAYNSIFGSGNSDSTGSAGSAGWDNNTQSGTAL